MSNLLIADPIEVKKLKPEAKIPKKAHNDEDAGFDLHYTGLEEDLIYPGEVRILKTSISVAIPKGYVGLIADRSSMAKRQIHCVGGVIDAGYRGELGVMLLNAGNDSFWVKPGDKIAQLLVIQLHPDNELVEVDELSDTERGDKGFGSTGK